MLKCSLFFLVMGVNFTNWKNMWRVGGHANNIELWNFPIWLSVERNRRNYPTKSRSLVNNTVTIRIVKIYLYHLLIGIFVNCFCCCRHCIHNYCEHVQYNLSFHYSVSLSGRTDNITVHPATYGPWPISLWNVSFQVICSCNVLYSELTHRHTWVQWMSIY